LRGGASHDGLGSIVVLDLGPAGGLLKVPQGGPRCRSDKNDDTICSVESCGDNGVLVTGPSGGLDEVV